LPLHRRPRKIRCLQRARFRRGWGFPRRRTGPPRSSAVRPSDIPRRRSERARILHGRQHAAAAFEARTGREVL